MNDAPRYFQPLELPEYCYLWEAVLWVGWGRFPEGSKYIIADGKSDQRDDYDYHIGALSFNWKDAPFAQDYRFHGFWWYEIEAAGLTQSSADWARYDRLLATHGYIRPETLVAEIERVKNSPAATEDEPLYSAQLALTLDRINNFDRPNYLSNLEKRLADTPFIDEAHRLFQHHVDRAWVKIFQALVEGSFQAYGWRELTQDGDS